MKKPSKVEKPVAPKSGRIIGYARVSTADQKLDLQEDALKKFFCDKIYTDKISGAEWKRDGLTAALGNLKEGDTFVVWKLDRLGRSMVEVIETVRAIQARGVNFISCTESIDTKTAMGRFCFNILAGLAELEREIISERTSAGMQAAIRQGKKMGPKFKISSEVMDRVYKTYKAGATVRENAIKNEVSKSTVARVIKEMSNGGF